MGYDKHAGNYRLRCLFWTYTHLSLYHTSVFLLLLLLFHIPEWQKPPEDAQVTHQNVQASEPQAGETSRLSRYYTAVCAAGLPTPAGHEGEAGAKVI